MFNYRYQFGGSYILPISGPALKYIMGIYSSGAFETATRTYYEDTWSTVAADSVSRGVDNCGVANSTANVVFQGFGSSQSNTTWRRYNITGNTHTARAAGTARFWTAGKFIPATQLNLVFMGINSGFTDYITTCNKYDNSGDSWATQTAATSKNGRNVAFCLGTDFFYSLGGDINPTQNNRYSYSGNSWTSKATNSGGSPNNSQAESVNSIGYFIAPAQQCRSYVEDTYTTLTSYTTPARSASPGFCVLGTDKLYINGGWDGGSNYYNQVTRYSIASNAWTAQATGPRAGGGTSGSV